MSVKDSGSVPCVDFPCISSLGTFIHQARSETFLGEGSIDREEWGVGRGCRALTLALARLSCNFWSRVVGRLIVNVSYKLITAEIWRVTLATHSVYLRRFIKYRPMPNYVTRTTSEGRFFHFAKSLCLCICNVILTTISRTETDRFAFGRVRISWNLYGRIESDADLLQEVASEFVAVDEFDDSRVKIQFDTKVEVVSTIEQVVVRRRLRHAVTV